MDSRYCAVTSKILSMYGRRVSPDDFTRMSGMASVSDVAAFLKSHPSWSSVLKDVNAGSIHRGQLEPMLWRGLYDEFGRIVKFLPSSERPFYSFLSSSAEVTLVLTFVRRLISVDEGMSMLADTVSLLANVVSDIDVEALLAATDYQGMCEAAKNCGFYRRLLRCTPQDGKAVDYTALESSLSSWKLKGMLSNIKKNFNKNERPIITDAIVMLADIENITRTLRIARSFPGHTEKLYTMLLPSYSRLKPDFFSTLVSLPSAEQRLEFLQRSPYKKVFVSEQYSVVEQYADIYICNYFTRLLHRADMSALLPIVYLLLKQLEIKNLIHTIECVRYRIPADEIGGYIVVA